MGVDIFIPKMGQTMTEGTVEKWLKSDGAVIEKGEGVVEIMTDKITTTIEASADGILEILIEEGNTVSVGEIIGKIAN